MLRATIVVNATPVGLQGEAVPVPVSQLPRDAVVMDLAYRPGQTPWILAARQAGHRAADGMEMLIAQGAEAFERWFGRAPDRDVMRQALAA
jgi:shikimate dehydrogenase